MNNKIYNIIVAGFAFCILATAQKSEVPTGKISGLIFGDFYYNASRDTGISKIKNSASTGGKDVNGMQIRQAYLNYDYTFLSNYSSRIRLETDETSYTVNSSDKSNKFGIFVKDAWFKYKFNSKHEVIAGLQGAPSFNTSENYWGHRFVEKTIMHMRGIVPTRDLAISLKGQFDSTGMFRYWLMYANSAGSKAETDKYKRYYANFEVTPIKNFIVSANFDYQTRKSIQNKYNVTENVNNDIVNAVLFLGYRQNEKFMVGAESFYNNEKNGFNNTIALVNKTGIGVSVFGSVNFNQKTAIYGRYDFFEPNNDTISKGDKRNWYIIGIDYKPIEKFTISPNVIVETYEKVNQTAIKNSITPRITINWTF